MLLRHVALKKGGEQNTEEEIRPRRPDIAADIQQITDQNVGMRVVICAILEAGKIEKAPVPIKDVDQQSRRAAAEETGDDPHREHFRPQGGAVDDELGI